MSISLLRFLRHGELNGITLGATRDEVWHAFGKPDAASIKSTRSVKPVILRFKSVEFHFAAAGEDSVTMIFIESSEGKDYVFPEHIETTDWFLHPGDTRENVEQFLNHHQLNYEIRSLIQNKPFLFLNVNPHSIIGIAFDSDSYLYSLSLTERRP